MIQKVWDFITWEYHSTWQLKIFPSILVTKKNVEEKWERVLQIKVYHHSTIQSWKPQNTLHSMKINTGLLLSHSTKKSKFICFLNWIYVMHIQTIFVNVNASMKNSPLNDARSNGIQMIFFPFKRRRKHSGIYFIFPCKFKCTQFFLLF